MAEEVFLSVTGGHMKGLDERLADPAVFLEIGGIARHRQAQQPDAVGKATQDRLILGDGTAGQVYRGRQAGGPLGRRGPSPGGGESPGELLWLGGQPALWGAGAFAEAHGGGHKTR